MGVICGVTTNPSLIAKEGRDFTEVIKEITSIVDGPISGKGKATTVDAEGMIREGREIAAILIWRKINLSRILNSALQLPIKNIKWMNAFVQYAKKQGMMRVSELSGAIRKGKAGENVRKNYLCFRKN